jgi:flagellar hook-associated protein 3 FlgL
MIDLTNQMSYRVKRLDIKNEKISYQMSTGKIIQNGSDDSILYSKYLNIESTLRTTEGLKLQIEKTTDQNSIADSSVKEIKKIIDTIKIELLKSLNSGMTRDDKKAVATNMGGIRDNLYSLMNTQLNGEFIFTGSNTSVVTYEKDADFIINGRVDFKGNAHLRNIAVEPNVYRDRGVTAHDVAMYNTDTSERDDAITFTEHETVIDQFGNTWKFIDHDGDDVIDKDRLYKIKENGKVSEFVDAGVLKKEYIEIDSSAGVPIKYTTKTIANAHTSKTISDNTSKGLLLETKHNIFDELNILINALKGYKTVQNDANDNGEKDGVASDTEVRDILSNALSVLSDQFKATNIGHSNLGGRNRIFDISLDRLKSKITHYNILMQTTNGANIAKLAMESKSLDLTYSALYSTITRLNNLSIVNFLK